MKRNYHLRFLSEREGKECEHWRVIALWFFESLPQAIKREVNELEMYGYKRVSLVCIDKI